MAKTMRCRGLLIGVVMSLLAGLLLACGGSPAPAAPAAGKASPAAQAALAQKVITLKSHDSGPKRTMNAPIEWFAQEVDKRAPGRVKFEFIYSGQLGIDKEQLDGVKTKLFDMGMVVQGYWPDQLPLWQVSTLPLVTNSVTGVGTAMVELAKLPEVEAEFTKQNVHFLMPVPMPSYELFSKVPIRNLAEIKGKRIRTFGMQDKSINFVGGVPVALTTSEVYDALEKGVLDANAAAWYAQYSYKYYEIAKHATILNLGSLGSSVFMNLDTWKSLPADIQKIMTEVGAQTPAVYDASYVKDDKDVHMPMFQSKGVTFYEFSKEDKAKLAEVGGKPVWDTWAKGLDAKGLPGTKIKDKYIEIATSK